MENGTPPLRPENFGKETPLFKPSPSKQPLRQAYIVSHIGMGKSVAQYLHQTPYNESSVILIQSLKSNTRFHLPADIEEATFFPVKERSMQHSDMAQLPW